MEVLTGVRLDSRCNLSRTYIVEEGDILTKDSGEIGFTEALRGNFGGVSPNPHEYDIHDKHADTCEDH